MTIGKDVPVDTAIGEATAVEEVVCGVELLDELSIVVHVGANFLGEQVGDVVRLLCGHTPVEVHTVSVECATTRGLIELSNIRRRDVLVQTSRGDRTGDVALLDAWILRSIPELGVDSSTEELVASVVLARGDRRVVEVPDEVLPEIDRLDVNVLDVAIVLSV